MERDRFDLMVKHYLSSRRLGADQEPDAWTEELWRMARVLDSDGASAFAGALLEVGVLGNSCLPTPDVVCLTADRIAGNPLPWPSVLDPGTAKESDRARLGQFRREFVRRCLMENPVQEGRHAATRKVRLRAWAMESCKMAFPATDTALSLYRSLAGKAFDPGRLAFTKEEEQALRASWGERWRALCHARACQPDDPDELMVPVRPVQEGPPPPAWVSEAKEDFDEDLVIPF